MPDASHGNLNASVDVAAYEVEPVGDPGASMASRAASMRADGLRTLMVRIAHDRTIQYVNRAFCERFRVARAEVIGQPDTVLQELLRPELAAAVARPLTDRTTTRLIRDPAGPYWDVRNALKEGVQDIVLQDLSNETGLRNYVRRYVTPDLADLSVEEMHTFRYPDRRAMSVSFTDLRGFSKMSNRLEPDEIRATFNAYLDAVLDPVHANQGTVDKVMGERVMAFYGAPIHFADHALRAVLTVCDQIANVVKLQEEFQRVGHIVPPCGGGVHTGEMVVGSVGSACRQDYTVLGRSVDIASQLCSLAKGGEVLVSETTLDAVLDALPPGWNCRADNLEDASVTATGAKGDAVSELPVDRRGRIITIGPNVGIDPTMAVLRFEYFFGLEVPGRPEPLAVISASRTAGADPAGAVLRDARRERRGNERIFGKYRIIETIGRGGVGEVWKARDSFGNLLAVKTLLAGKGATRTQMKRFMREAKAMSRLRHPGICQIHEVGEAENAPYIAMEYVEGANLSAILGFPAPKRTDEQADRKDEEPSPSITHLVDQIQNLTAPYSADPLAARQSMDGPSRILPLQQAVSIVIGICEAIQFAHERGVLHRDLKPGNIMIRPNGEAVVMDFGMAKMDTPEDELSLSMSGDILGTLDYMAPEQAASTKDVNEQADVYSIGALLYRMTTGHKPFKATGNLLQDAQKLQTHEPDPPSKHNPEIEPDLEVITLTAMNPDRERRYRSAAMLAEELQRFRSGQPIAARPPHFAYKLMRAIRQHHAVTALAAAVALVLAAFGGYAVHEQVVQTAEWLPVYHADFTAPGATTQGLVFQDSLNARHVPPWKIQPGEGLVAQQYQWCWLSAPTHGDVRVALDVVYEDQPGSLNLCVNSRMDNLPSMWHVPPGVSAQIAGYGGTLDIVTKDQKVRNVTETYSRTAEYHPHRTYHVVLTRAANRVRLRVDDGPELEMPDFMPLHGKGFNNTGLVFHETGPVTIRSLTVHRLSLPQKTQPTVAGDSLARWGRYAEAAQEYLSIAGDYAGTPVGERALMKAYLSQQKANSPQASEFRRAIVRRFQSEYPSGEHLTTVLVEEAASLWDEAEYEDALDLVRRVFALDPDTRVVRRLFSVPHRPVSAKIRRKLAHWIQQSRHLYNVDVHNYGFEDLDFLRGLDLRILNCAHNRIRDLGPIAGMNLRVLDCSNNALASLDPIQGMPLVRLSCEDNRIRSLEPLENMPLRDLNLPNNQVESLEPLHGMPVKNLNFNHNWVESLAPLAGLPLKGLSFTGNRVSSLEPLAGAALDWLNCAHNRIESIAPLRDMDLTSLDLSDNRVPTLEPVRGMQALRWIFCADNPIADLSPLEDLRLEMVDCRNTGVRSLAPLQGMPLTHLNCAGSPITSLDPFLPRPPGTFLFRSKQLPDQAIRTAISRWRLRDEHLHHARNARLLLALRADNPRAVRELGEEYEEHTYLHIPFAMPWKKAVEFCERHGGHPVGISDEREDAWLTEYLPDDAICWLGARVTATGDWTWVTGDPWFYTNWNPSGYPRDRIDSRLVKTPGGTWMNVDAKRPYPFVIEWKE